MTEAKGPVPGPDIDQKVFDKIIIESPNARIGVNPEGGYVTSWKVRNPIDGNFEGILYVGSRIKRTGIPILFPNYGNSGSKVTTHGFGRDSMWTTEYIPGSNKVVMILNTDVISDEARIAYPYEFETTIKVEAAEDGRLLYSLKVKNLGDKDMPITPGLHPYFALPHEDKTKVETEGIEGFDATSFDWDTNPPDNAYDFSGKAVIKMPKKQIVIEDITPNGRVAGKMVVWSQTPEESDYNFTCFEPVTKDENSLANDPILVPRGSEWNMNLRFSATLKA